MKRLYPVGDLTPTALHLQRRPPGPGSPASALACWGGGTAGMRTSWSAFYSVRHKPAVPRPFRVPCGMGGIRNHSPLSQNLPKSRLHKISCPSATIILKGRTTKLRAQRPEIPITSFSTIFYPGTSLLPGTRHAERLLNQHFTCNSFVWNILRKSARNARATHSESKHYT
jgi:hypothetical protein